MRCVDPGSTFETWRTVARGLIQDEIHPSDVLWEKAGGLLNLEDADPPLRTPKPFKVPAAFVQLAETVACHQDLSKWSLLYRILWRLLRDNQPYLLEIASDPDISKARMLEKNVRREIHKMHAFVRFRLVDTHPETGRERYVAWFEPDHFIIEAGTPFFRKRFANMDWSIFTPKGCAHWNGENLAFTPGVLTNPIDRPDELEAAWKIYYQNIFNPARLKVKAMQTEMPKKYWKNLPEAELIQELIDQGPARIDSMLRETPRPLKPAPRNDYLKRLKDQSIAKPCHYPPAANQTLVELASSAAGCQACPLWKNATQTIFGVGPETARVMIIGEQPGDREDAAGSPFVGPAGKLLDRALADAGIDRRQAYLTNAVKHFKWIPKGKLRLHQKPNAGEIDACRPWVLAELSQVAPDVLILLGATATHSLLGKPLAVTKNRGLLDAPHLAKRVIVTVHPSYLLRIPDDANKAAEYELFVADLKLGI